ncbi:hypothetical protein SAMN05216605_119132 [Pseudomonas abietaniphila]|uniref:Uncharacterized protein n=1 Tax=Pseudomonas abietaniphila TaxID=89065 RepID=A0A1G8PWS3_9PSED|nr:hypothetical protein SAMN05216605_119132 [Pseudomonas abietaniphila]
MDNKSHPNAPTANFIRSMREVATTLNSSYTSLLSSSVRLAEAGQDQDAMRLIELAKGIQWAESKVWRDAKDAGVSRIVKLSEH